MTTDRTEKLLEQVLGQVNSLTEKRATDGATLTALVSRFDRQREDFIRSEQDAKEHRQAVRTDLDKVNQDVKADLTKLNAEVGALRMEQAHQNLQNNDIKISLTGIKAKVDKLEDRELIKLGGNKVIIYLSRFALVALGGLASAAGALFQHWLTTRGH